MGYVLRRLRYLFLATYVSSNLDAKLVSSKRGTISVNKSENIVHRSLRFFLLLPRKPYLVLLKSHHRSNPMASLYSIHLQLLLSCTRVVK